jgi:catechol 2,3-dioxygenase-like lactoylglutathione lyase family enzyme
MLTAMKLNHLDLRVRDVPATIAFFTRHFGLRLQTKPDSPTFAILTDGDGFVLVLQRAKEGETYPPGFHLGFLVDDAESVVRLQIRAREEGANVSEVQENGRGTMVYFTFPEGYLVEVAHQHHRYS